jgi:SAM-dependent methyltransferase
MGGDFWPIFIATLRLKSQSDRSVFVSFDQFAETYEALLKKSTGDAGEGLDWFTHAKARWIKWMASQIPGDRPSVLDYGCGVGLTDSLLQEIPMTLTGVDVSEKSLSLARQRNPWCDYQVYDGARLPYPEARFDLIFVINVLHHVVPESRDLFLSEAARVLKPGGKLMIFEHNPLNPVTRKVVRDCPFDEGVILLPQREVKRRLAASGLKSTMSRYILFFPFKAPSWRKVEDKLGWLPLGAQHLVIAEKL